MFLKNYTSEVPARTSLFLIEEALVKCGVSGITKEYGAKGEISAVRFHIESGPGKPVITVRLPVSVDSALELLWTDYRKRVGSTKKVKEDFRAQAERTAWRLMQDWVEVQLSMIELKQAEVLQVFLPYVWDDRRRLTFFEDLKGRGFKGLLAERGEAA